VRYAKIPALGWRRGSLVQSRNGQTKPNVMLYSGREVDSTFGQFQIRTYKEGGRAVHVSVGDDLTIAQNLLAKHNAVRGIAEHQITLGIPPEAKPEDKKTIEALRVAFLKKRTLGASKSNTALYSVTINSFCIYLAREGKTLPEQITGDDVYGVYLLWREQGREQYTCANRYSTLRGFLHSMKIDPKEIVDKVQHAKMSHKPKTIVQTYSDEEVSKLIAVSSERHGLLWECFQKFGFRDEEMATLEFSNIDWINRTVEVKFKICQVPGRVGTDWRSKDSEERAVPVPESLLVKLAAWHQKNLTRRFVFGTKSDTPDIKFLRALKSDWRAAGLNCGRCKNCIKCGECERAFLHKFRASYLTRMFQHCENPRDVMALAGHSSLETSLKYLKASAQPAMQRAINKAWA
jgi:integrase